jgi:hypothetical protein
VNPRAGVDEVEKSLYPTGTRTPTPVIQHVASRFTDCAIPAHFVEGVAGNKKANNLLGCNAV